MKKILLVLFLAMAGLAPVLAQDYAPFKMGRTPYFQAGDSVYSLQITNAFVQGADSVFEFNPRVVPTNTGIGTTGCPGNNFGYLEAARTPNNIFGAKILKTSTGDYKFVFTSADTFLLKPNATIGESWLFGQSVTATLQSRTMGVVHGQPDSIATIFLSNGHEVKLAQHFGLLSSRSFVSYIQPLANQGVLQLKRLPEAGIGNPLSDVLRIYDFQPGDKFLYHYEIFAAGTFQCEERKTTLEVLNRYDSPNGDTIQYQLKRQRLVGFFSNPICSWGNGWSLSPFDTITQVYFSNMPEFHHLSDLSRAYREYDTLYYNHKLNIGQEITGYNSRWGSIYNGLSQDTCSSAYFGAVDLSYYFSYAEGLGKTVDFYASFGHAKEELIAYIKGTETYGNWQPLVLSSEQELAQPQLQVFPNPFTSELTLQLPEATSEPAEFTVYNMQGQRVHQLQIADLGSQSGQKIVLPALPAGLYLLQVQQGEKSYSVKVQRQ